MTDELRADALPAVPGPEVVQTSELGLEASSCELTKYREADAVVEQVTDAAPDLQDHVHWVNRSGTKRHLTELLGCDLG